MEVCKIWSFSKISLTIYVCVIIGVNGLGLEKYKNYKMVRVQPQRTHHIELFKRFEDAKPDEVQVMKEPVNAGDPLDLLTSPGVLEDMIKLCKSLDIPLDTILPDLPSAISEQITDGRDKLDEYSPDEEFRLDRYHTLKDINKWLYHLQQEYPDLLQVFSLGFSWEGRTINAVKITKGSSKNKAAIWMDAGIHSNEWIGPATMLYFINQFTTKAKEDKEIGSLLDNFVFYILPVFNVDGYDYTWKTDRFWRKTRSVHNPNRNCAGVDMNRNFDIDWFERTNRNQDECSRVYAGPYPFSEPENQAVESFLRQHNQSIVAYVAYHSYSQYWMTPFGFTDKLKPSNYRTLDEISKKVVEKIEEVHGMKYKMGSISELVGRTVGSSVDYTYTHLNIRYSFGVELRDDGRHGTLLPPDQIIPNGEESFAGIKVLSHMIFEAMEKEREQFPSHKNSRNHVFN